MVWLAAMTDDIVTRLREMKNRLEVSQLREVNHLKVSEIQSGLTAAADEIERLREWKELAYLMRNSRWWILRNKHLMEFDYLHRKDREKR
jgi:hypothetical protein